MAAVASSSSSQNTPDPLQATVFQRLHPRAYLERFLAEGFRPDGREAGEWRDVSVNVGSISTADGSALVRLGDTTIVCGIKAEIAEPELDNPGCGFLVPNLDLPAICSPRFKPGPPTDDAQVLSERLYDALISADVVDLTSLCIEPGKSVWTLYVDATCINYDGNAFDAALLAMIAALKNVKLPVAKYNEEREATTCSGAERAPLQIKHSPVAMSFGLFDSTRLLTDPTSFEEPLLDTTISVIVDELGQLVSVAQYGPGSATQQDILLKCIASAKQRRKEMKQNLSNV